MKVLYFRTNDFKVTRFFTEDIRYFLWNGAITHWMYQDMEDWWDFEDYDIYE